MTNLLQARTNIDGLAQYKTRVLYLSSTVTIFLAIPLVVANILEGYHGLAAAILVFIGTLVINLVGIRSESNLPATMALVLAAMILVLCMSISQRGAYGVFWVFPEVLFLSFGLSRRLATLYAGILVTVSVTFSAFYLEARFAFRSFLALAAVVLFANIFLSIIDRLQEHLIEQNSLDPLTGALNRRTLDERLIEALDRKRRSDIPASLLMIDLDHFKSLNDTYGHAAGDEVLKKVAALINDNSRRLDKLSRLGGEEFLLFLPDTPQAGAEMAASKLLKIIAETLFVDGRQVTVSIGVSELQAGEPIETWMERADNALYQAKTNGRNQMAKVSF